MTDTMTTQDALARLIRHTNDTFGPEAVPSVDPYRQKPTSAQTSYAESLARSELACPDETIAKFPTMSRIEMSRLIQDLKNRRDARLAKVVTQAQAQVLAIPAGRYALVVADRVRLYRVRISATTKRPYLVAMVGNGERYMGTQGTAGVLLTRIAEDPKAAAMLYAEHTGHCSKCGILLTDPKSVAAKIGPDCAKAWGW